MHLINKEIDPFFTQLKIVETLRGDDRVIMTGQKCPLIVKYGGTSLATPAKIKAIAAAVLERQKQEPNIVVVVSAMAGETNRLLALANAVAEQSDPKELDALLSTGEQVSASLLAMAIKSSGGKARSFNGSQLGILTDSTFGNAKIKTIFGRGLKESLRNGEIPVITGFQGLSSEGEVTTLGRGGSDTTAVAIAAHLQASLCEIFTDVDGVFSADPNLCANAKVMSELSFEEMENLAGLGAKVLHDRSVTLAQRQQIAIRVRPSSSDKLGTLICSRQNQSRAMTARKEYIEDSTVKNISVDRSIVEIRFPSSEQAITSSEILLKFIDANINIVCANGVSIILRETDLPLAKRLLATFSHDLEVKVAINENAALISIIGSGLSNQSSVLKTAYFGLVGAGIKPSETISSDLRVSFLIEESKAVRALQELHSLFFGQAKEGS